MDLSPNPVITSFDELVSFPNLYHEGGSIAHFEKIIIGNLLLITRPRLVVETGLFKGYTHRFIAEFLRLNNLPECRVVSFDFPEVVDYLKTNNIHFDPAASGEMIGGQLPGVLARFLEECEDPIDFAVIDADHSFDGVMQDLQLIVPRLRSGGYVFCHDYRPHDPKYAGLTSAIDDYCLLHGLNYLPLVPGPGADSDEIWGAAIIWKPIKGSGRFSRLFNMVSNQIKSKLR